MKSITKLTSVALLAMGTASLASAQTFLIDFGDGNGTTTGNWNNSNVAGFTVTDMVDTTGSSTAGYDLFFTSSVGAGAGFGVGAPAPFDVASAYTDALFTSGTTISFKFSGLDNTKTYNLDFFGSRTTATDRFTDYTVSQTVATTNATDGTTVSLQTSGDEIGGTGVDANIANIATVAGFTPTAGGEIFIDIDVGSGGFAYLNAMQLTVVPEPSSYALLAGLTALAAIAIRRRRD